MNEILNKLAPAFGLKKVETESGIRWGYIGEYTEPQQYEYDMSWREPTEIQLATLKWVCKRIKFRLDTHIPIDKQFLIYISAPGRRTNPFELAEMVML